MPISRERPDEDPTEHDELTDAPAAGVLDKECDDPPEPNEPG